MEGLLIKKSLKIIIISLAMVFILVYIFYIAPEIVESKINKANVFLCELRVEIEYRTEGKYDDSFIKLCEACVDSNNVEKAIKYSPVFLDNKDLVYDGNDEDTSREEIFDRIQSFYLLALLHSDKQSEFKNEFISRFSDFKTNEYKYYCFTEQKNSLNLSAENREFFSDVLGEIYKSGDFMKDDETPILTLQMLLYKECGNTEKMKEAQDLLYIHISNNAGNFNIIEDVTN
ncbi:MAG: hypothetical protein BWY46_01310 [Firmicutes bacterium ADurb.Bin300]|nr:MAG: hypothetical protein BWY46_01310 [Firmicutes bacterium ADurb.Bin300]